jgi:hypothetical protein
MLDGKLQLKQGQAIALVNSPYQVDLAAPQGSVEDADAVLVFVKDRAEFDERFAVLRDAARRGALTWLAYPKAKQLDTDLNRDIIHNLALERGLDAVRQVSIDNVWSALRFKLLS